MAITATSPLVSASRGRLLSKQLGDNTAGRVWCVPPGSVLPPGLSLDTSTGTLTGVPTTEGNYHFFVREDNPVNGTYNQREFSLEVVDAQGIDEAAVQELVVQAFQLGRINLNQAVWFDESSDSQGRRVIALKVDDNGQERTIASITV